MKRALWCLTCLAALLALPAAATAQLSASFLQTDENGGPFTTYTYASINLGAAAADRMITVVSFSRKNNTTFCTAPTVTIGGVAATLIVGQGNNVPSGCNIGAIHKALVPSGATGNIVLTYAAEQLRSHIAVYRTTGPGSVMASDSGSSTANDPTGSIAIEAGGYAIGGSMSTNLSGSVSTATWTGLTELFDAAMTGSAANAATGALLASETGLSTFSVDVDWTATVQTSVGVWAAWEPYVSASSPTHYVTPSGNTGGSCTIGDPCTLTRAFALAGTATIPPGSWVSVAAGIYNQAAITTTGGGVSGATIRFVGAGTDYSTGSRIVGTRTSLPASSWSLCAASTYSYCASFDDAALYDVRLFAQRPGPLMTTWEDITVDDRQAASGWAASGRAFTLDEPVRYTIQSSAAAVEAQHCTFYHNTTTNILYMHPCREAAPTDGDQYYAGSDEWGTLIYENNGDYLTLEGFSIEHTNVRGIFIDDTATGTILDDIRMLSSHLDAQGRSSVITDVFIKEVIDQGQPHAQCYSIQYGGQGLSSRSCWNAFADGYGLLVGSENSGLTYNQSLDRITVERGWNGIQISGPNTMDHTTVWGFGNHGFQSRNTGVTVTNSIFMNSQDVQFNADESWENQVFENNIWYNSVLFWCGRLGSQNGAVCPTTWTFRNNLVYTMQTDHFVEPTVDRDCNVWLPRTVGQDLLLVTQSGGSHTDYTTLAGIQAAGDTDDNSIFYAANAWSDGSIFANFTSQQTYPIDFTLASGGAAALTTCGAVAGPDTLAGDAEPEPTGTFRLRFRVGA